MANATPFQKPTALRLWMPYAALAGIAVLALVLRLHLLGAKSLWFDEGISAAIARLPWTDFFTLLWRREANMGFYYLLLRGWINLGASEFLIRLLSVVFGVASVVAVWALGRRLFGCPSGLVAALLLALHAFHLRYSQEARSYSLLVLLVTLSSYWFVRMLESPSARNRRLYLSVSALAFYTQFFAILVTAAQFVALALFDREHRRAVALSKTAGWIAALYAPGTLWLLLKNRGQLDWIPAVTLHSFYDFLQAFTGRSGPWLLLVYAAACALAVVSLMRTRAGGPSAERFAGGLAATWLALPVTVLLLASMVKPLFVQRYTVMCLPALTLLASAGLQKLRPVARSGALVLLAALSLLGVRNYYTGFSTEGENWRDLARLVVSNSTEGDGIIFDQGLAQPVFEYYRGEAKWPLVIFPAHGNVLTNRVIENASPGAIRSMGKPGERVWLVAPRPRPPLERAMLERFSKSEQWKFTGVMVQLYVRRPR